MDEVDRETLAAARTQVRQRRLDELLPYGYGLIEHDVEDAARNAVISDARTLSSMMKPDQVSRMTLACSANHGGRQVYSQIIDRSLRMEERKVVQKGPVSTSKIVERERLVKVAKIEQLSEAKGLRRHATPIDPQRCGTIAPKLLRVILRDLPMGIGKFGR